MTELLLGILSGIVGAFVGMFTARKLWFSGNHDKALTRREQDKADDEEADRIISLLKEYHELALKQAKLESERRLGEEIEKMRREHHAEIKKLREEFEIRFRQVLGTYGCEVAPTCKDRIRRVNGF